MKMTGRILSVILAALMLMNAALPVCFAVAGAQPAEGHDHVPVLVEGKKPTCTEEGLTDGWQCEVCKAWIAEQVETRPKSVADMASIPCKNKHDIGHS